MHLPSASCRLRMVSIYAYINPIVAVGLGWLLLQEKIEREICCWEQ